MKKYREKEGIKFQFTPLREGRRDEATEGRDGIISIHAPPRGATELDYPLKNYGNISIHAPPRGATNHGKNAIFMRKFQFTPLREGRRGISCFWKERTDFNSRPSARGDEMTAAEIEYCQNISIHAPPRGATRCMGTMCSISPHFNSRPSARGDYNGTYLDTRDIRISIHAPPRGATSP